MTFQEQLKALIDKCEGISNKTWEEITEELGLDISPEVLRKSFSAKPFGGYCVASFLENLETPDSNSEKIQSLIDELKKERIKNQRINRERNETLRVMADRELFNDLIVDAIENLKPIEIPDFNLKSNKGSNVGALFVADAHYGKKFKLIGRDGIEVNEYSPEYFKSRMWDLLDQLLEDDILVNTYDKLIVFDLGDCIDGILRATNSLRKLQVGVMDSVLQYSEFMAQWLVRLQEKLGIPIEYTLTGGNHDMCRFLSSKKDFDDENVARLIREFICLRLKDCENIKIDEYNEEIVKNICGTHVLAYHGDCSDLKKDIAFFEDYFSTKIDILVGGHLHRGSSETIGVGSLGDKEIIRVPSICGTDDYAKKIRKNSLAGAKLMLFNAKEGKFLEKVYHLN